SEVLILPEKKSIYLSKLFDWHKDFFKNHIDKIEFIRDYINDIDKKRFLHNYKDIDLNYFYFDWSLND
ncbi:MAG: hypothetical protein D6834_02890, partial [Aquificota bacterium]